jgi:hypothetical protein
LKSHSSTAISGFVRPQRKVLPFNEAGRNVLIQIADTTWTHFGMSLSRRSVAKLPSSNKEAANGGGLYSRTLVRRLLLPNRLLISGADSLSQLTGRAFAPWSLIQAKRCRPSVNDTTPKLSSPTCGIRNLRCFLIQRSALSPLPWPR